MDASHTNPPNQEEPLIKLIHGVPLLAFTINAAIVTSHVATTNQGLAVGMNSPATSAFVAAMMVSSSFALSSITYIRSFRVAAAFFGQVSLCFLVLASASVASAIVHGWYAWITYATCVVPMLPLFYDLSLWLHGHRCSLLNLIRRWFRLIVNAAAGWCSRGGTNESELGEMPK